MGSDRNPRSGLANKNPVNIKEEAEEFDLVENKQPKEDKISKKGRKTSIKDN